ncbi:HNH endonuclease [Pyxidicoccus fallax]|uniref:HNH endonuclease n=1 Tax=Pyxidicoccus fallax TaxID=394095 RepID=A0A848LB80_9BACT|nr:HNH endonuclease signature motif containing protein [Pyxidicoccus fallax]NMO15746.1 HNH endonuclease [Pyxidicoccus fallax]NPC77284.1 HNH endonuclease [Pyxidicoccus fallax]
MSPTSIDPRILESAKHLTKRARLLVELIIARGSVTMEELTAEGYAHAARAAADVRDAGIPLVTTMVKSPKTHRPMAVYSFGDPSQIVDGRIGGRSTIPKKVRSLLVERDGERCAACLHPYPASELQVDHRVPFRVGGEPGSTEGYMLLCRSCQRSKSWACEHCPNWTARVEETCRGCFWASPSNYQHVATRAERRVSLVFEGPEEIRRFDELARHAAEQGVDIAAAIKAWLSQSG